jgi:hypothetical protein
MKKLHVKMGDKWKPVFCKVGGRIITCEDSPRKALPPHARWADADLKHFQNEFGSNEFCLLDIKGE